MKRLQMLISKLYPIVLIMLFLSSCNAADKFEDYVLAGDYEEAISVYQDKISGNVEKERDAQDFLRTHMNNSLSDYAEGKIDTRSIENIFECLSIIDENLSVLEMDLEYGYEDLSVLQVSKENFDKAVSMADKNDYKGAMALFAEVNKADVEHYDTAKEQMEVAQNKYKAEMIVKIQTAFDACEYDTAISLGIEANDCLGANDSDFQNLIDLAYYKRADDLIDSYIHDGEFSSAIQTYKAFVDSHPNLLTADMSEKMSACKKDFKDQIIETSKALYFEKGAEAALTEVKNGRSVLEDDKLEALYELYLSAVAVSWKDVAHHTPSSGVTTNFTTASDYYGNKYQGDLIKLYTFWMYKYPPLEIIPNGAYTNLTTTMFPDEYFGSGEKARLTIYGDNILIYDSGDIVQRTKAIDIDIDITNVEILEIKLADEHGDSVVWLQEVTLYRKLTEKDIEFAIQ